MLKNGNGEFHTAIKGLMYVCAVGFLSVFGWLLVDHLRVSNEQVRRTSSVVGINELQKEMSVLSQRLTRVEERQRFMSRGPQQPLD